MIRNGILKTETAKPAIRQIQMDFFTQPPLGADAEAVSDDQHANHQLGIDRGAPRMTVKRRHVLTEVASIEEVIYAA
ncbi:hypothetical protein PTKU46_83320 [Paraburkholderia terrae]